jgi:hypothetical protein
LLPAQRVRLPGLRGCRQRAARVTTTPAGAEGGDAGLLEALAYVNGRKAALEAELIARERAAGLLEAERNAARHEVEELRAQVQVRPSGRGATGPLARR